MAYHTITAHTKLICILGHPVEHTMSPLIHNAAFQDLGLDLAYVAFDVLPNQLKTAFKAMRILDFKGANITIPHKEESLSFMDEIDPLAKKNCSNNYL